MTNKIRTRFAPSPTGFLHMGSLRTVLFDFLIAKSLGGKFILRIEDTDQKREVEGAVEKLIDIIEWFGIKIDEGPHVGGEFGPYIQSQRLDIYKKYIEELLKKDEAYPCFCTEEKLKAMREEQQAKKMPPRYDRACRDLKKEEAEERMKKGEKYVIRQKMPISGEILAHDELRGEIKFNCAYLDDHILMKSNGIPTYQFANVVDDHFMEITHVVRGEEWIPSFPKNILLYNSFGWTPPKFFHMTLTLNKGGGKLSKRQGDVSVEDYRAKGYLPEALLNFSVLLGWHPEGEEEIISLEEMVKNFKIEKMGTHPAVFDIEKLDYFNGYYIRHMDLDKLTNLCIPFLQKNDIKTDNFEYIKKVIALEQERLKKLSEIGELTKFFFEVKLDYDKNILAWKKMSLEDAKKNLTLLLVELKKIDEKNWERKYLENYLIKWIKESNYKNGEFLWPLRVALTGREASPSPFEVAEVLGKERSISRVQSAISN